MPIYVFMNIYLAVPEQIKHLSLHLHNTFRKILLQTTFSNIWIQTRQHTDLVQDLYFTSYRFKFWGPWFFVFTFSVVHETILECVRSEWAVCQNLASDILTSRFLLENFCTNSHLAIRVLCPCSNLSRKYGQYKLRIKFSLRINCGQKFHRVIHLLVAGFPCRAVEETNIFPWEHQ